METKNLRRKWTREETLAFLDAYSCRKAEFLHPMKKKVAMANVLEDLLSRCVLTQPTSVEALNIKLKNLLRSFKQAKDNAKQTGGASTTVPFEEQLEELLGDRPIVANNHTLAASGAPIEGLPSTSTPRAFISEGENEEDVGEQLAHEDSEESLTNGPQQKKSRMTKEKYLTEKLKILKEYATNKIKQRTRQEELKQKRHEEKIKIFNAILENINKN